MLYDEKSRERYIPLQHLAPEQARFCVYNSLLSEQAVLGFDYGYSLNFPQLLCMWEAQFGDFSNGAQVIIDQFIVSAESKWQRPSGIVLLLPHGYEGQGPEHSSGRLERFLQLCAEENIQVCNLTTPAQYFHVLRRQMKRPFRKPLVIMTPKSLLRAAECVSTTDDFTKGHFHDILPGPVLGTEAEVKRLIFCSGKVYYDLLKYQNEHKRADAAIIRVEQLYPLNEEQIREQAARFPKAETYRLVPGRIPKHGRVDLHRTAAATHPRREAHPLRRPQRQRQPRGGLIGRTQDRAAAAGAGCVYTVSPALPHRLRQRRD